MAPSVPRGALAPPQGKEVGCTTCPGSKLIAAAQGIAKNTQHPASISSIVRLLLLLIFFPPTVELLLKMILVLHGERASANHRRGGAAKNEASEELKAE